MKKHYHFDAVSFLMAYENGELDDDALIDGFQELLNSGLLWRLQDSYHRVGSILLQKGLVSYKEVE